MLKALTVRRVRLFPALRRLFSKGLGSLDFLVLFYQEKRTTIEVTLQYAFDMEVNLENKDYSTKPPPAHI